MFILEAAVILPMVIGIDLQIQSSQSSISIDSETSIANSGNLTGNHDSESNPDGTITIPGLWGGSGNQEIPIAFDSGTSINGSSNPTGFMAVEPFVDQDLAIVYGLSMDLLNTSTIPVTLTITLDYQSFHTENPNCGLSRWYTDRTADRRDIPRLLSGRADARAPLATWESIG